MQKRWLIHQLPSPEVTNEIETNLKVSPLMAKILAQRGLTTLEEIRSFFEPEIIDLHDPFLMLNLKEAVIRLEAAVQKGEKIIVFGDYDVDGTTAVALVYSVLEPFSSVSFYIPDRYEEGYGLSYQGIDFALENGATLMIVLDCGIKEIEKVAYAKERGLDIIICDHHTPGEVVPDCIVLDPKQLDCKYPYKELCGCGVGFKLMQGWLLSRNESLDQLFQYLDLVAIAIGADIVPVTGENRLMCKQGLKVLNASPRQGIQSLLALTKKTLPLDLTGVVFTIAPRINAAGRLESGMKAVQLLLSKTKNEADAIAFQIEEYNTNRRLLDAQVTSEALEQISDDEQFIQRKSTVVFQPDWHKGVVGIVASRLIEQHYRPTIVLTESKGFATGSARSVEGFNIYNAIESCEHLLTQFGGHHHAAGLTLPLENMTAFINEFDQYVQDNLTHEEQTEELSIDLEVRLDQLFLAGESVVQIPRILTMLNKMEPFGPQNNKPVFLVKNVYASSYKLLGGLHLKIDIMDPKTGIVLPAICFNMPEKEELIAAGCAFDCAFTLETNTWNNKTLLQLQIKDIRETV